MARAHLQGGFTPTAKPTDTTGLWADIDPRNARATIGSDGVSVGQTVNEVVNPGSGPNVQTVESLTGPTYQEDSEGPYLDFGGGTDGLGAVNMASGIANNNFIMMAVCEHTDGYDLLRFSSLTESDSYRRLRIDLEDDNLVFNVITGSGSGAGFTEYRASVSSIGWGLYTAISHKWPLQDDKVILRKNRETLLADASPSNRVDSEWTDMAIFNNPNGWSGGGIGKLKRMLIFNQFIPHGLLNQWAEYLIDKYRDRVSASASAADFAAPPANTVWKHGRIGHALRINGTKDRVYVGWAGENGNDYGEFGITEMLTDRTGEPVTDYPNWWGTGSPTNDHALPRLCPASDNKIMVFSEAIGTQMGVRVSDAAEDISSFAAGVDIPLDASVTNPLYPMPVWTTEGTNSHRVYLLYIDQPSDTTWWTYSDDDGSTWSTPEQVFGGNSGDAPQVRMFPSEDRSEIHFVAGSPFTGNLSFEHWYYNVSAGTWHGTDGTDLGTPPFTDADTTTVYSYGVGFKASWYHEVKAFSNGEIAVGFTKRDGTNPASPMYARWNGSSWDVYEIESGVMGGASSVAIDWGDPDIAYYPRDVSGTLQSNKATFDGSSSFTHEQIGSFDSDTGTVSLIENPKPGGDLAVVNVNFNKKTNADFTVESVEVIA